MPVVERRDDRRWRARAALRDAVGHFHAAAEADEGNDRGRYGADLDDAETALDRCDD